MANSSRYPTMPSLFILVAAGTYDSVLYRALRQAGVIVVEQLAGIAAAEKFDPDVSVSRGLISGCRKFVAFMLLIVPK